MGKAPEAVKAVKEVEVKKVETTTKEDPWRRVSQVNWRNVFLTIAALLLLALLVLGIIWFVRNLSSRETQPVGNGASQVPVLSYQCNSVAIGTPTTSEGKCDFCTINLSKPGDVFIVGEKAQQYPANAWVFQYTRGDLEGFKSCINGQPFMSDSAYKPIWK